MRTSTFTLLAASALLFSSCMKHASDYQPPFGEATNTWTFSDGTRKYFGNFLINPVLNTTTQANGTYTLEIAGTERLTGQQITMAISLTDKDLDVKSYHSGISGSDHATAFYYSGSAGSRDAIYSSTNNDPGAVMTFNIHYYNKVKNLLTIHFSGQVHDASGNLMNISEGKMTAFIDRK